MLRVWYVLLIVSLVVVKGQEDNDGDTKITRVQPLTEEQKRQPIPREKTRSIYLVNLLPVPNHGEPPVNNQPVEGTNDLKDSSKPSGDPRGRNPTLFLLQKVNENGHLPDGIYYRPAEDENGTPPPVFQKDLTDIQAYILGRATVKHPGRQ